MALVTIANTLRIPGDMKTKWHSYGAQYAPTAKYSQWRTAPTAAETCAKSTAHSTNATGSKPETTK